MGKLFLLRLKSNNCSKCRVSDNIFITEYSPRFPLIRRIYRDKYCTFTPQQKLDYFQQKMPLQEYHITEPHGRLGLWHITEDEDYFLRKLPLSDSEKAEIAAVTGRKKLEKLAGKLLIKQLTGWAYSVVKDDFGKPFFKDSDLYLSLSHSGDYVVGIISEHVVGIDIQYITPKIERVAPRVMNENKLKNLDPNNHLEHLHVYWGAKEALYKAYGQRSLDFKKHIIIEPFNYTLGSRSSVGTKITEGVVLANNRTHRFDIFYKKIKNYILVYAIEKR